MAKSKLDDKIDKIISMLIDGKSYREIAKKFKVGLSTLHDYTSKAEHSARVEEALRYSASTYDDKAEQVLIEAVGTREELMRARELAQHYRWKAAKRNPKKYGDSTTIKGDKENPLSIDIALIEERKKRAEKAKQLNNEQ